MKATRKNRTGAHAAFAASTLAVFLGGCGSMQQARLDEQTPAPPAATHEGEAMPVLVGNVTASVDQPADLREAVCRYLRDQTAAAIARHGTFVLVNTNAPTDLLSGFGIASTQATDKAIAPQAAFDVEVIRLEEKLGATVKVGFVSSQQKHAVAGVKVTLRSLTGGENLTSVQGGKSSKGAWGVITSVNRDAMREGGDVWTLDGSMIGLACAEAVRTGVDHIARRLRFRAQALDTGIEKRLLRPRTERGLQTRD